MSLLLIGRYLLRPKILSNVGCPSIFTQSPAKLAVLSGYLLRLETWHWQPYLHIKTNTQMRRKLDESHERVSTNVWRKLLLVNYRTSLFWNLHLVISKLKRLERLIIYRTIGAGHRNRNIVGLGILRIIWQSLIF